MYSGTSWYIARNHVKDRSEILRQNISCGNNQKSIYTHGSNSWWKNFWKTMTLNLGKKIIRKLTLLRMSLLQGPRGWWGRPKIAPLPEICHTYPTMMKLGTVIPYLKRSKRYTIHVIRPLSSAAVKIFSPEISNFCCIKKYKYMLHFNT